MKHKLLLAASLAAIPLTVAAQSQPPSLSPEQIVAARRAGMFMSGGNLAAMKSAAEGGGELKMLAPGAQSIRGWARVLPTLFPEGSNVPPTKAKAEVWSDRAGFDAAAANLGEAAARLAEAANGGDREAFMARWAEVRGACGACHDAYKN